MLKIKSRHKTGDMLAFFVQKYNRTKKLLKKVNNSDDEKDKNIAENNK